jgi:hypothetical protein
MKSLKFFLMFATIFSFILFSGCSKDDNNQPQPQPEQNTKEYKAKKITIPDAMAQSDDYGAQMATAYINMVNGMATYGDMLNPPGKSCVTNFKDGGTETYTWDVSDDTGNYTITLKIWSAEGTTYWEMYITGKFEEYQMNNFKFIEATQSEDGSKSTFVVYDPETGNKYMSITWTTSSDGTLDLIFEVYNETFLHIQINADGSGSLELKEWQMNDYVTTFKIQWDASGHGQWWQYDNGEVSDSGSW